MIAKLRCRPLVAPGEERILPLGRIVALHARVPELALHLIHGRDRIRDATGIPQSHGHSLAPAFDASPRVRYAPGAAECGPQSARAAYMTCRPCTKARCSASNAPSRPSSAPFASSAAKNLTGT